MDLLLLLDHLKRDDIGSVNCGLAYKEKFFNVHPGVMFVFCFDLHNRL